MSDAPRRPVSNLGSLGFLMEGDRRDRRGIRLAVVAAVGLHLVLFAVSWPTLELRAEEPDEEIIHVYPLRDVVFEQPPPRRVEPPRIPPKVIFTPDKTPFDPEPIDRETAEEVDFEIPPDIVFGEVDVPEPPPDVETAKPIRVGKIAPPEILFQVTPCYTDVARRAGTEGAVIVDLVIDTEGRVTDVKVLRGLPFGLTDCAVEAVQQWRFEPCTFNGRPVAVQYILTVRFRLQSR